VSGVKGLAVSLLERKVGEEKGESCFITKRGTEKGKRDGGRGNIKNHWSRSVLKEEGRLISRKEEEKRERSANVGPRKTPERGEWAAFL